MPVQDAKSSGLEILVADEQLSVAFVTGRAPKNIGGGVFVFKFWGLRGSYGSLFSRHLRSFHDFCGFSNLSKTAARVFYKYILFESF